MLKHKLKRMFVGHPLVLYKDYHQSRNKPIITELFNIAYANNCLVVFSYGEHKSFDKEEH